MNIIQMQNDLKGMSEETLINIVKNPTGQYPIYLALSEIERQKNMRERYNAIKPEESSIAEKLVGEAEKRTGIASMVPQQMIPGNQGVSTPPETPEMTPTMLAASGGIVSNPVNNIGKYAEGGIVGFKNKGFIGNIYDYGKKKIFGQKGQEKIISPGGATPYKEAIPNILSRNPKKSIAVGGSAGAYFIFGPDGKKTPISDEEANKIKGGTYTPPENIKGDKSDFDGLAYARESKGLFDELVGSNEGLKKIEDKLTDREENLLSDFFINAGLNTAMGKDANFVTNLAEGVGKGYDDMQKSEKEILSGQLQIAKGNRAEDISGATAAMGSLEKERTRQSDIEKAKIMSTVQGYNAPVKVGKMLMKAYQDSQILQRIGVAEAAVASNPGDAEAKAYLDTLRKEQQMINETVYTTAGYTYAPPRTAPGQATSSNNQVYNVDF